jgi:hypothetical protein
MWTFVEAVKYSCDSECSRCTKLQFCFGYSGLQGCLVIYHLQLNTLKVPVRDVNFAVPILPKTL